MLAILREIVQEVNNTTDLSQALAKAVTLTKQCMKTQACSIFLVDAHTDQFVLTATDGLNPDAIHNVRFPTNQGLVGLVGKRAEPINLEDASIHPHFYQEPVVEEEKFKAFLGVPIIHRRNLLGVLIIQQEEARRFDEDEEAILVTLCAQLAGTLAYAKSTGAFKQLISSQIPNITEITTVGGVPCVAGVAMGKAIVIYPPADLAVVPIRETEDIEQELLRFNKALKETKADIAKLKARLANLVSEDELALFDAYLRMLDYVNLGQEIEIEIKKGIWAQGALKIVIQQHINHFEDMDDDYLKERADDIKDLGLRLLANLQKDQEQTVTYAENTILVGETISAANLAEVPKGQLAAIVSTTGSRNSHVAILARALGIPAVLGVDGINWNHLDGVNLIVDGYYGHIYINPTPELEKEFQQLIAEENQLNENLQTLRNLPAETLDGHLIELRVNAGLAVDAGLPLSVGASGVGLFRTEVPFMIRDTFPAEEEQKVIYRQLLAAFSPRPVIMRTLDVGGDKCLPYFEIKEENPYLGWRGIRMTLDHPEVFLVQVRAMLKASEGYENLGIMLPMISSVNEVDEALGLIEQAYDELLEEGFKIKRPKIGVMIEVPSAVYQAGALASRVDFLSIGSNDLTQYILAVDRNNARVADLYDSLHPAVLHAMQYVVDTCKLANKHVSICGEMASDPVAVVLLLAMGFDSLSMNSASLLRVKYVVRNFSMTEARELLSFALQQESADFIRIEVERALDNAGLGGLIRAGSH